ncbi:hypothetical protein L6452_14050 [Arctium lappa]|uniref:Uncharacterized protein n=1 Tax=Arctium lappa TaxID=4217 RepID=A0ACB9CJU3_ARCLA|nr:hypothetical protein L6452_14050 [Arctium lappa]
MPEKMTMALVGGKMQQVRRNMVNENEERYCFHLGYFLCTSYYFVYDDNCPGNTGGSTKSRSGNTGESTTLEWTLGRLGMLVRPLLIDDDIDA